MKKRKDEIIPADKNVQKAWLIMAALYVLFLVWLEPLIDFMLMQLPLDRSHEAIVALNQKKAYVAAIAFGVARSLPILMFLWLGFQIVQTQRLPPRGLRLPFTVHVTEGPKARTMGMVMVAVSFILLFRELTMLVNAQPVI